MIIFFKIKNGMGFCTKNFCFCFITFQGEDLLSPYMMVTKVTVLINGCACF